MPTKPTRGFACPTCHGHRLQVYRTRKPRNGLVARYRKCSACGNRVVTEERLRAAKSPPPKSCATSVPAL